MSNSLTPSEMAHVYWVFKRFGATYDVQSIISKYSGKSEKTVAFWTEVLRELEKLANRGKSS